MPEGYQNHGGVTMPVTIVSGRLHEPFDLALGEVLAGANGISQPPRTDCSLYSGLEPWRATLISLSFFPVLLPDCS